MVSGIPSIKALNTKVPFSNRFNNQILYSNLYRGFEFSLDELLNKIKDMVIQIIWVKLLILFINNMILNKPLFFNLIGKGHNKIGLDCSLTPNVIEINNTKERIIELTI